MTPEDYEHAWRLADREYNDRVEAANRARVDELLDKHRWDGGYFCRCGIAMNSPSGWGRHLLADAFELEAEP